MADNTEWKEAFALFDTNNNGQVLLKSIGTVMRSLGQNPTDAEVAELTRGVQGDAVDYNGFCKLMNSKFVTNQEAEQEILAAFKVFDKSGSGLVSAAELRHVMTNLGEPLTAEEVDELIGGADLNDDGTIQYQDFVRDLLNK